MKNIFKKISAIAASALMVGMTMGVAAAASYPAPFVDGGIANVAIVYGTGAGVNPSDQTYAGLIEANLASSVTSTGGTPTGDNVLLERSTDKFNLLNNMSSFYTSFDEGELSVILAKGIYSNDAHDDFDYTQEILLSEGLQLTHFLDSKFNGDQPIVGFDLADGKHILNYTLKFTPDDAEGTDTSWSGITNSEIPLFSKPYYVLSMTNTTATNHKLTLLNAAASATLNAGEATTLTIEGASYDASISYLDNTNVKLVINGEETDSLAAGETQKLTDGTYVGIKSLASQQYAGGQSYVEFSIGSGKLVLENTKEVEINNAKLSDTEYPIIGSDETVSYKITSYISTSGNNIDSIVLDWELDDATWIAPGTDITLPGFETVKLSMTEFVTETPEVTTFEGDSSKFEISTTVTEGALTLPIFYLNSSSTGIEGLGKDSTNLLVTNNVTAGIGVALGSRIILNETEDSYFVVTWINGDDFETYAYELESVDENINNQTVLHSMVTGGSDITLDADGDWDNMGNVKFTLDFANEKYPTDEYVILNISAATVGSVYTNKIVTSEGLTMMLPFETNSTAHTTANGYINATEDQPITWTMNVTEEDATEAIEKGNSFSIKFDISGTDGLEAGSVLEGLTSSTMYETEDGSKIYEGYMPSDLATNVIHSKPTSGLNDLTINYFGSEAYALVYLTEAASTMEGSSGSLGNVVVKDTEVSSVSSKNLIVVGGSCINSAAAFLVGSAACESDFTDATGIGSGQFLIQSFGDAYSTGKVALLVAGYTAADTINAVTYLKTKTVDTTAGNKYTGTSETEATLSVVS